MGVRLAVLGPAKRCLDVQDHCSDYPGGWKDGVRSDRLLFRHVTPRQRTVCSAPSSQCHHSRKASTMANSSLFPML
ncbi:unnamed protein product [Merluccius merluccius]